MKKTHIVILILFAVSIAVLVSFMGNLSTYETIASARQKSGKTVTIIARLDRRQPIRYDPAKDPNYLSFHITDTLGNTATVVYHAEKPYDLEKAERITLKGKMDGDVFNVVNGGILIKCPSKYKDDPSSNQKALSQN
ncbi:MAG TPA: cytochrome c maturation protein CcmE [Puia sp.]|jgi:cytochrome c-type biogenesis protein CcmE|nr:cytochrome c maturation protein CcmE [Puia sp.]